MINIVYEDNHVIVCEKPRGILCQADITGRPNMLDILKGDIKTRYNKPGNVYLGLVHRLDRPVGGIMVFAKTSKAASRISQTIREGGFGKEYLAVIYGRPQESEGTLENMIAKDRKRKKAVIPDEYDNLDNLTRARVGILDYRVLKTKDNLSLVKIVLKTGRFHQIRVQFSQLGNPLYGDEKYSGFSEENKNSIALWAHRITFKHPVADEIKAFTSYPPKEYPWSLFPFPGHR